jgi:hypothetical protein
MDGSSSTTSTLGTILVVTVVSPHDPSSSLEMAVW